MLVQGVTYEVSKLAGHFALTNECNAGNGNGIGFDEHGNSGDTETDV